MLAWIPTKHKVLQVFSSHYHLGTREGCGEGGGILGIAARKIVSGELFFKNNFHESALLSGPIILIVEKLFLSKEFQESDRLAELGKLFAIKNNFSQSKIFGGIRFCG